MEPKKVKSALELDRYMAARPASHDGMEYHAPFEPGFRLAGFAFQAQLGTRFRRLPVRPDGQPTVNERVDELANYTAGLQLAFRSTSRKITIKARLRTDAIMHHMPQTGSSSFDLYVGGPGAWRSVGSAVFPLHATEFDVLVFEHTEPGEREYLLNFPLYNGVEELWVGLEAGSSVRPPTPWGPARPVVVYGTSITQGGCSSRPGLAWTNILSRWRNREFFNFGFSGNGRGEPEMAEILAGIENPGAYILDYEANAQFKGIQETLERFIGILRAAHPAVPIVLISLLPPGRWEANSGCGDGPEALPVRHESRRFQKELIERLRRAGDGQLFFIDGGQLLGNDWDECTMDGVHLNDLGFYRMAEALNKRLPF